MPNVEVSRGIGEHGQSVEFRAATVFSYLVNVVSRPPLLPLLFNFLRIISESHTDKV
jgi:hypothetical protein